VTPAPGREDAQTSEGSDTVLAWHVEDAFTEDRCDLFGLLCLRGEPAAATSRARRCPACRERGGRRARRVRAAAGRRDHGDTIAFAATPSLLRQSPATGMRARPAACADGAVAVTEHAGVFVYE
jgi:hypothetical protein